MTKITKLLALSILIFVGPFHAFGQVPAIDGLFDDWEASKVVGIDDPKDDAQGEFDIVSVQVQQSNGTVYLHLTLNKELNLQNGDKSDGQLLLNLDLPNFKRLTVDFRKRIAFFTSDPATRIPWNQIGFECLPTFASKQFEVKLNLSKLGIKTGNKIKIGFEGSDELPSRLELVVESNDFPLKVGENPFRPHGDVRIANMNTLQQGLADINRQAKTRRLLSASNANIFCFQEEWNESEFLDSAASVVPHIGNLQTVWSSGCGIATVLECKQIPMQLDRAVAALVKLRDGNQVVVISVHFKCCGFAGSKEDELRVQQAQQLAKEILKLRTGQYGIALRNSPIVLSGDYNLVGSRKPLNQIYIAGLKDAIIHNADDYSGITWRGLEASESFWPGRLDLICFDPSRLIQVAGFAIDTAKMDKTHLLSRYELDADTSKVSDHLLLVADFKFRSAKMNLSEPYGAWNIRGVDEEGENWIGTLIVKRVSEGGIRGHVDWAGDEGSGGREYIQGTYDPVTRLLEFSGTETENANEEIVIGSYRAVLSSGGTKLVDGKWDSNDDEVVPGAWTGSRIFFDEPELPEDVLASVNCWNFGELFVYNSKEKSVNDPEMSETKEWIEKHGALLKRKGWVARWDQLRNEYRLEKIGE